MQNILERTFRLKDKLPWFHPKEDETPRLKEAVAHAEAWLRIQQTEDYKRTIDALFIDLRIHAMNLLSSPATKKDEQESAIAALCVIRAANDRILSITKLGEESAAKLRAIAEKQEKNDGTN